MGDKTVGSLHLYQKLAVTVGGFVADEVARGWILRPK
jgi:hypothetical protein